jgi:hypothetical protein
MTLPLIRLLAVAPTALAGRLRQVLAAPGNHKREALRPYLEENAALEYAYRKADEFAGRARGELGCVPFSACRAILELLCDKVVRRSA